MLNEERKKKESLSSVQQGFQACFKKKIQAKASRFCRVCYIHISAVSYVGRAIMKRHERDGRGQQMRACYYLSNYLSTAYLLTLTYAAPPPPP